MIKRQYFLLSLLLLPYLAWVIAAVFSLFLVWPLLYAIGIPVSLLGGDLTGISEALVATVKITSAYTFGVAIWGMPYTLFAIIFLIWSRNKSIKRTYTALILSPIILALIAIAVVMLLGFLHRLSPDELPLLEDWQSLQIISLRAAVICLVFGYILVGIGIVGYRLFDYRKLFINESEIPRSISGSDTIPSGDNFKDGAS